MVDRLVSMWDASIARGGVLVAAATEPAEPLLLRLDPPRRAQVIMTLVGLLLLGGLLLALIVMGGRRARRLARQRPRPTQPAPPWYHKPLSPPTEHGPGETE